MKHALIIEDDANIAVLLRDELADLGYQAAIAATQKEAIDFAAARDPDLIVADVRLRDGSGIEAVRQICRVRPIAVVFMTGDLESVDVEGGKVIALEKPFTVDQLRSAIRSACSTGTPSLR